MYVTHIYLQTYTYTGVHTFPTGTHVLSGLFNSFDSFVQSCSDKNIVQTRM